MGSAGFAHGAGGASVWSMVFFFGLILALAGVALYANGHLAARGKLTRNHYFLARRPAAMQSNEGWPAALQASGPTMAWAGALSLVVGVAVMLLTPDDALAMAMIVGALVGTLVLAVIGGLRAQRAALAAHRRMTDPVT